MRLSYLLPFTFILSSLAQNWNKNLEYLPEEESFIENEYINEEEALIGLMVLEDAEVSFSWLSNVGDFFSDAADAVGGVISDTADAIGDGVSGIFDDSDSSESPENPGSSENPEDSTPEVIDTVSPITYNTTIDGYTILAYREESLIIDEPGSRMSTNATLVISGYYAGRITAETRIWTEKENWGFVGEVYVELLDANNITIGNTSTHNFGVNGEFLDPEDGIEFWEEWLQASVAWSTVSLRIVQTHNETLTVESENFLPVQSDENLSEEIIEAGAAIAIDTTIDSIV